MSVRIFILCSLFAAIAVLIYASTAYWGLRSATVSQKEFELFSAASDFSASLSPYGNSPPSMSCVSPYIKRRLLITDENFRITYDSSDIDNLTGKIFFHSATSSSLRGETFFECSFLPDSVESRVSVPIVNGAATLGCLILLESDSSLHYIFDALGITFFISSLAVLFLFFALWMLVSNLLNKRISHLLSAIKKSRTEFLAKKIPVTSHDEITPVIEEFNHIYEQLNYTQQMRQAFVSDASHELRTPLAAIRLLCESITGTSNIDTETTREFMGDIILEVDRMSHTAEKLLVLSRLDNSSVPTLAPVPMTEIVKKTLSALSPIAEDKNITIEAYLEESCTILAEMEGTNQIVSNLIDNAIKYNSIGGTLRVYLYSKNDSCIFITDDTGIGIAPEYREQVFERFYRVDKSRKHDGRGGSGLGLAIVKRNIDAFGGHIEISDSVFGGARFTVTLPKLITEESEEQ